MASIKVKVKKVKKGMMKAQCPVMPAAKVDAIRSAVELMGLAELESAVVFRFAEDKKKEFIELLSKEGFEVQA